MDTKLAITQKFDALVAQYPELQRKGKANPYCAQNGNMFAFVTKEGELAFRFSEKEKTELIASLPTQQVIQHNSVMRGYVKVPASVLADEVALKRLFEQSLAFVLTLPVKPSKKK